MHFVGMVCFGGGIGGIWRGIFTNLTELYGCRIHAKSLHNGHTCTFQDRKCLITTEFILKNVHRPGVRLCLLAL